MILLNDIFFRSSDLYSCIQSCGHIQYYIDKEHICQEIFAIFTIFFSFVYFLKIIPSNMIKLHKIKKIEKLLL